MSDIILKFDKETVKATPEYIAAIKQLLIAEIKMMRASKTLEPECWYCGACKIGDTATTTSLSFQFGPKSESKEIKIYGQVYVEVKFEKVKTKNKK